MSSCAISAVTVTHCMNTWAASASRPCAAGGTAQHRVSAGGMRHANQGIGMYTGQAQAAGVGTAVERQAQAAPHLLQQA